MVRNQILQVSGGPGGCGGSDPSGACGPPQRILRGKAVLPQPDQGRQGLTGEDRTPRPGEFLGRESRLDVTEIFLDPALALRLTHGFLQAALGGGVNVGLGRHGLTPAGFHRPDPAGQGKKKEETPTGEVE